MPAWLGQRGIAIWRTLTQRETGDPDLLPLTEVRSVGSAIHVSTQAARRIVGSDRLELWLREYLIDRIPGAGTNPERADRSADDTGDVREPRLEPAPAGTRRLSQLLGANAVSRVGRLAGSVVRIFTTLPGDRDPSDGPVTFRTDAARTRGMQVTELLVGRRGMWLLMEHERPGGGSGPPLLGRLVRAISPADHRVPWDDVVQIDWDRRRVVIEHRTGHDRSRRGH